MRIKILIFMLMGLLQANDTTQYAKIEALEEKNKALFAEVKVLIDELVKKEQESLNKLLLDGDSSVKELQKGLNIAYSIADANGLDVEKLKALYELSKKVILRSDFVKQDSLEAISTANSFAKWFDVTGSVHAKIQEEKAKAQEQRLALYKKVTLQYIKALTQQDAQKAYDEFRKYSDALRTIQSADADILIAQAQSLVAEQKLIADLSSGLPFVGEALDVLVIATGEDLSGQKLSNLEKGVSFIALITPEILTQLIKRNPVLAKSVAKISATLEGMSDKALSTLSKSYRSKKALQQHLASLKGPSDEVLKWREFYKQKHIEKKKLLAMDDSVRNSIANDTQKSIKEVFERKSPLGEYGDKITQIAKKRDEIIITRPVSDDLIERLNEGAYTKGMNVKGKSANSGVASGYVPKNQKFSKLSDEVEIKKYQKKVDESLMTQKVVVDKVEHIITPQRVASKQLIVTKGDIKLEAIEIFDKKSNKSISVYRTSDAKIVNENLEELSEKVLKNYDVKNAKPFEVLTDMDGNYLTADIDLLAVGSKKSEKIMQNDVLMGNINHDEMATVGELNRAMKDKKYPDRQLVHHGGENSFMSVESKLDFPLSAYSPDGKVAVLKSEKELKKYFHAQKLRGYDLQPNPYWGWGEYDPKIGYK